MPPLIQEVFSFTGNTTRKAVKLLSQLHMRPVSSRHKPITISVVRCMIAVPTNDQVASAIIFPVSVPMVDHSIGGEVKIIAQPDQEFAFWALLSEPLFHHESVFEDVTVVSKWMIPGLLINITSSCLCFSTLPHRVPLTGSSIPDIISPFNRSVFTFLGTVNTSIKVRLRDLEILPAIQAFPEGLPLS